MAENGAVKQQFQIEENPAPKFPLKLSCNKETLFFIVILIFVSTIGIWGVIIASAHHHRQKDLEECLRNVVSGKEDNIPPNELLSSMNLKVDPCEDFYQYACGNYKGKPSKIQGKNYPTISKQTSVENSQLIQNILEFPAELKCGASEKIKDFYTSCVFEFPNPNGLWECEYWIKKYFPADIVLRHFTEKLMSKKKEEQVRQMFLEISSIFEKNVQRWFLPNDTESQRLVQRIRKTSLIVGAPPTILNTSLEAEVYQGLSISKNESSYQSNFETLKFFYKPRLDFALSDYTQSSPFYNSSHDTIYFLAGSLPQFDQNCPNYMRYGSLGVIMAHEYTNALVECISQDAKVWGKSILDNFKTACLRFPGYVWQNSTSTLSLQTDFQAFQEDLADVLGLQVAFAAFKNSFNRTKNNYQLVSGLECFTPEQRFFISAAQQMCTTQPNSRVSSGNTLRRDLGGHNPPKLRVLQQMSNFDQFAEAFSCPVGSVYNNPLTKCENYF